MGNQNKTNRLRQLNQLAWLKKTNKSPCTPKWIVRLIPTHVMGQRNRPISASTKSLRFGRVKKARGPVFGLSRVFGSTNPANTLALHGPCTRHVQVGSLPYAHRHPCSVGSALHGEDKILFSLPSRSLLFKFDDKKKSLNSSSIVYKNKQKLNFLLVKAP